MREQNRLLEMIAVSPLFNDAAKRTALEKLRENLTLEAIRNERLALNPRPSNG